MVSIRKNGRIEQMRIKNASGKKYKVGDRTTVLYKQGELTI